MSSFWISNSMTDPEAISLKSRGLVQNNNPISQESLAISSADYYHGGRIGMSILAAILLIAAGLSTGLILAICGLDCSWLEMKSVTGTPKERKYIQAITLMRSHGTWMLCSLVICTVACSEYFPFVIQNIYPGPSWIAVLISTVCITIFVELIPQCLIPNRPLIWGYYCRWVIWTCMGLTAIVSWPIALIFNHFSLQSNSRTVFKNHELRAFIKYHNKSEKNGGQLGPDASRIINGALNLDHQSIRELLSNRPDVRLRDEDLEKAVSVNSNITITFWDHVKMIDIDDQINEEFINKLKCWSYSRIPVVGRPETRQDSEIVGSQDRWESTRIYGLLFMKSLVGYNHTNKSLPILVRDLPLHPLPIINEEMSIYALLNVFELEISKMAVIVPTQEHGTTSMLEDVSHNIQAFSQENFSHFFCPEDLDTQRIPHLDTEANTLRSTHNIGVTSVNEYRRGKSSNILGTKIPRPIGLITLQNVIDAVFQKTSHGDMRDNFLGVSQTTTKKSEIDIQYKNIDKNISFTPSNRNELRHRKGAQKENESIGVDKTTELKLSNSFSKNPSLQGIHNNSTECSFPKNNEGCLPSKELSVDIDNVSSKHLNSPLGSISPHHCVKKRKEQKSSTIPSRKAPWHDIKKSLRCTSAGPTMPVPPHLSPVDSFLYHKSPGYEKKTRSVKEQKISEATAVSSSHSESLVRPVESNFCRKRSNSREIIRTSTLDS